MSLDWKNVEKYFEEIGLKLQEVMNNDEFNLLYYIDDTELKGKWEFVIKRLYGFQLTKDKKKRENIYQFLDNQFGYGIDLPLNTLLRSEELSENLELSILLYLDKVRIEDTGQKIRIVCGESYFYIQLLYKNLVYISPDHKNKIKKCYDGHGFNEYFDDVPEESPFSPLIIIKLLDLLNYDDLERQIEIDSELIINLLKTLKESGDSFIKCLEGNFLNQDQAKHFFEEQRRKEEMKKYIQLLEKQKQIILYGPPGTGKTFLAKQVAAQMLGFENEASTNFQSVQFSKHGSNKENGAWDIVQFHPSYNYEDFVRGITVTTEKGNIAYETKNKIFAQMCKEASNNSEKPYILIIDEINRADLASVLGELIYALEYRGEPVATPYKEDNKKEGDSTLNIPKNLYIIGTMNTADRSIGHIDYAVRRRFAFQQVLPDITVVDEMAQELFKKTIKLFGANAFQRICGEADEEANVQGILSPDYHWEDVVPGHSYFMVTRQKDDGTAKTEDERKSGLAHKFVYQVWPLLEEYHKDGILSDTPAKQFEEITKKNGGISLESVKEKLAK